MDSLRPHREILFSLARYATVSPHFHLRRQSLARTAVMAGHGRHPTPRTAPTTSRQVPSCLGRVLRHDASRTSRPYWDWAAQSNRPETRDASHLWAHEGRGGYDRVTFCIVHTHMYCHHLHSARSCRCCLIAAGPLAGHGRCSDAIRRAIGQVG